MALDNSIHYRLLIGTNDFVLKGQVGSPDVWSEPINICNSTTKRGTHLCAQLSYCKPKYPRTANWIPSNETTVPVLQYHNVSYSLQARQTVLNIAAAFQASPLVLLKMCKNERKGRKNGSLAPLSCPPAEKHTISLWDPEGCCSAINAIDTIPIFNINAGSARSHRAK